MVEVIPIQRRTNVLKPSRIQCLVQCPTINLTAGCAHQCVYCYARGYKSYPGEGRVLWYENTLDKLKREFPLKRKPPSLVYFSTSCDVFQPVPEILAMAHEIFCYLLERGVSIAFLTKGLIPDSFMNLFQKNSSLIEAQMDLLSTRRSIQETFEPFAASPGDRIRQAKQLKSYGIDVRIRLDPILPGFTDDEENIVDLCSSLSGIGIDRIVLNALFLRRAIRNSLSRLREGNASFHRIQMAFMQSVRLNIQAGDSSVEALSKPHRKSIYDRIAQIAKGFGIQAIVCSCKNPDLSDHYCGIAGDRPPEHFLFPL